MSIEYFVDKHSVVRQIWGKSDIILFIFAGASAEFALNKAIDWLYFTGRLPDVPLSRLFSTVSYVPRAIVFSEKQSALRAINALAAKHAGVEEKRGIRIPDWAYRDVLFMLIDYSIRFFEVLERELSRKAGSVPCLLHGWKLDGSEGVTEAFEEWEKMRQGHQNLQHSRYTNDLFNQYRKHLGGVRYRILLEAQTLVMPKKVHELLGFRRICLLNPLIGLYKLSRSMNLNWLLKALILPSKYKNEIKGLDRVPD